MDLAFSWTDRFGSPTAGGMVTSRWRLRTIPSRGHAPRADAGASPPRETIAWLRRLSVRRSVQLAMLVLVLLGLVQMTLNHAAIGKAGYMLRRAETSYRQLDEYQMLSVGLLEWIALDGRTAPQGAAARAIVESSLDRLDRLTTFEVEIVRANGGDEANLSERARLRRIRATIEAILAEDSGRAAAATYRSDLKPLLDTAVGNEKTEVGLVERAMGELQQRMAWIGALGIALEVATIVLVLALIARAVLDPLTRLVADIGEFGRGRLGHRVALARRDEFGLLALHINRMAKRLERGRQELVALNDSLEATVAERTQALQDRNEELREIDESRRRFFVDVSHELRTPLTAIVGEADVTLRDGDADAEACREALASILANSTYLNRRIDDLMALARSSSGRLELHCQTVDLNTIAAEALAEIRSLAKINQVMVRLAAVPCPLPLEGDRLRIRQCLMILLDNAVKFSRADQIVDVRLANGGANAELTVVNRGSGIAPQDLPAIFERFYQTEVGRRKGGTGLGLAIARRIVEAHGGAIAATSPAPGETAITITLPLIVGAIA